MSRTLPHFTPLLKGTFVERPILYHLYFTNPIAGILEAYRNVLFYGKAPDLTTLGMAAVMTLLIGVISFRVFWKIERDFADLV